ncbi:MAG TPA: efflux RND transporter periplasmic adaptor subunit [Mizugakiibacter sp.]
MKRLFAIVVATLVVAALVVAAYRLGAHRARANDAAPPSTAAAAPRKVLYWYDPMAPQQHFARPGKSPLMPSMDLLPKYADEAPSSGVVRVDPAVAQNLGLRTQTVRVAQLASALRVPATIAWDQREAYVVSARVDAVVDRLYVRAPFDAVRRGQPLAALLAPEWSAALAEYRTLAEARSDDARMLRAAARERLRALGLDDAQIAGGRDGDPRVVVRAPADGVVAELPVREGERVDAGMPILRLNGLDRVWVEADVPQAEAGSVAAGAPAIATVNALPGERFGGRVESLLPDVDLKTRTQRVRVVLDNPQHRLAPGMFAEVRIDAAAGAAHPLVPDEALIATGDDTRVVLAVDGGYHVVRVHIGRSADGMTEVLDGLTGGERVVVSAQFLIDSEASLSGALQRLRSGGVSGASSDDALESGSALEPAAPSGAHAEHAARSASAAHADHAAHAGHRP